MPKQTTRTLGFWGDSEDDMGAGWRNGRKYGRLGELINLIWYSALGLSAIRLVWLCVCNRYPEITFLVRRMFNFSLSAALGVCDSSPFTTPARPFTTTKSLN